ncbi:response regulator [Methanospirillum hungatei]|nr:response regulator [Methanospirillum hungatei]
MELVQERPPDVILLDFMMPGMDGFEVRDYLRKYQNCEELI